MWDQGLLSRELMHDPQGMENPELSRDPVRTPMQWDGSANAGFCPAGVKPQRSYANQCYLVALNFSVHDQVVTLPEQGQGRILLSTHVDVEVLIPLAEVHLRGNEGLLIEMEASSLPG